MLKNKLGLSLLLFFLGSIKNIFATREDIIEIAEEAYFSWIDYKNKHSNLQSHKNGFFADSAFIKKRELSVHNLFQKTLIRDHEIIDIIKKEEGELSELIISEIEKYISMPQSIDNMLFKWASVFTILNHEPKRNLKDDIIKNETNCLKEEICETNNSQSSISEKALLYKLSLEAKLLKAKSIRLPDINYWYFYKNINFIFQDINIQNNHYQCIIKNSGMFCPRLLNPKLISYQGYLIINAMAKVLDVTDKYLKTLEIFPPHSIKDRLDCFLDIHLFLQELKLTYHEIIEFVENNSKKANLHPVILTTAFEFIKFFDNLFLFIIK